MLWTIEFYHLFAEEFRELPATVQDELLAVVTLLEEFELKSSC